MNQHNPHFDRLVSVCLLSEKILEPHRLDSDFSSCSVHDIVTFRNSTDRILTAIMAISSNSKHDDLGMIPVRGIILMGSKHADKML